jgi:hypothetical protein
MPATDWGSSHPVCHVTVTVVVTDNFFKPCDAVGVTEEPTPFRAPTQQAITPT